MMSICMQILNLRVFVTFKSIFPDFLFCSTQIGQFFPFASNFYVIFKGIFNKYEQLDICELYLFLIQKIHDEICRPIPENKSILSLSEEHNYKIAFYNDFKYSNIYRLFQGSYIHIIKCLSCNHIAKTFEPFSQEPLCGKRGSLHRTPISTWSGRGISRYASRYLFPT